MEGPSISLAVEQLSSFINKKIISVSGNTKRDKERLKNQKILDIFSHGKQLFFQFDLFALRVHFLLYGSFEATINNIKVTGDYPKKNREARLALSIRNGHIDMYNCSVSFIEQEDTKSLCDYSIDIMAPEWDSKKAYKSLKASSESEVADVLLDQSIFAGVGNIIKNEVLLKTGILPTRKIKQIADDDLKALIKNTRDYVFKFFEWRKNFVLKSHYQIYRQSFCKQCGAKVKRKKTGLRERISYICEHCEK